VVDNKPGGSSVVGAAVAAKSAPDGNTWLIVFDNHILNSIWTPALPYKDSELMPVMQIGAAPGHRGLSDAALQQLRRGREGGKAEPGKISVGALAASLAQIFLAFIQKENGLRSEHHPLQGRRAALPGRAGRRHRPFGVEPGQHDAARPGGQAQAHRRHRREAQQAHARGADARRARHQGDRVLLLVGRLCTGRHAKPIVERMHAEIAKAVRSPDVTQKFIDQFDMEIVLNSPEQFAAFTSTKQEFWARSSATTASSRNRQSALRAHQLLQLADGAEEAVGPASNRDRSGDAGESRPPGQAAWRCSRRIGDVDARQHLRHQGAPGAQALGELGPAALGAGGEQDQLHVQERRAAQRIVTAALGGAQSGDEIGRIAVTRQQLAMMF